jgi:hypothetical protein
MVTDYVHQFLVVKFNNHDARFATDTWLDDDMDAIVAFGWIFFL